MLQPIQLQVNYEYGRNKQIKKAMEQGGDQPETPIIQDYRSSRRDEREKGDESSTKIKPLS